MCHKKVLLVLLELILFYTQFTYPREYKCKKRHCFFESNFQVFNLLNVLRISIILFFPFSTVSLNSIESESSQEGVFILDDFSFSFLHCNSKIPSSAFMNVDLIIIFDNVKQVEWILQERIHFWVSLRVLYLQNLGAFFFGHLFGLQAAISTIQNFGQAIFVLLVQNSKLCTVSVFVCA